MEYKEKKKFFGMLDTIVCPECGYMLYSHTWTKTLWCINTDCKLYEIKFEFPKIEPKLAKEDSTIVQSS